MVSAHPLPAAHYASLMRPTRAQPPARLSAADLATISRRSRYYYLRMDSQIWFFTIYDKDEATDLMPEEKRMLRQAIEAELAARRHKR